WVGTLAIALVLSLAWGYNEYRQAGNYRLSTENNYQRSFADLVSHLDQLETDMAKGRVANTPSQRVLYLTQTWSQSEAAMKEFAQLPAEEVGISHIGQFINQVGDFSRNLAQKVALGDNPTSDEEKTYNDMHDRMVVVNRGLQDLMVSLNTQNLGWVDKSPTMKERLGFGKLRTAEASAEGQQSAVTSVRSGLNQLEASLQKLPPFSYTGEHATKNVSEPLGLPRTEVTKEQAQTAATEFLSKSGYPGVTPEFVALTQGPLGGFQWKYADVLLEVSKRGGKVILYRDQREIQGRNLSIEDAKRKAQAALDTLGWKLALTSVEDMGTFLQVDAVNEENGVRIYPDKVRLTVGMDNGQLVGFDATPYYAYHHSRDLTKKITVEQAKSKLRQGFQVKENRITVIPKPGNIEVVAYEFRGIYQGEEYLVYINAQTGTEERIQRIIRTPRGEYLQ
nr:germination protein YpeB [Desulfitobacterium hafniense]